MPARILVVDDHPLTREALAALLRSHGFELARGESRRDAIGDARAAAARPHLVEEPARDRPREGRVALHDAVEKLRDPLR